jgi:hypothetical protein
MIRAGGLVASGCLALLLLDRCSRPTPLAPDAGDPAMPVTIGTADSTARAAPLHVLDDPGVSIDASPANWVDCVAALHVVTSRGFKVANAERLGESHSSIGAASRIADLAPSDLRAFCDWEACIRTNGYGHLCGVNDAGWESCRLCNGTADCSGLPADVDRAQCHVALLEECLLQRAIRQPADERVT